MRLPSRADPRFWKYLRALPPEARRAARKSYRLWLEDPRLSGLRFKHLGDGIYSIRVTDDYRAIAYLIDSVFVWVWIGTHEEYDRLV